MRGRKSSHAGDLEVDAYDPGLQYAYNREDLPEALYPTCDEKHAAQKFSQLPASDVIIKNQQGTTFRLSVALVLSVVFAIVAGAIAATLAMQLHAAKRQIKTCPNIANQTNNTNATMVPTSDCKKMTSTYNSIVNDASYNLYCNIDQPNGDLMSVWVYTFEDCIHACSSYDFMGMHNGSYCYGISYAYTIHQNQALQGFDGGNCWLKGMKFNRTAMYDDVGVDSAFLIHE